MTVRENIHHALDVVQRRRLVAVISLIVGLAVMVLALRSIPKTYEAASRVLIVADNAGRDPSVTSIDLPSVATSTVVLQKVMDDLKLPDGLAQMKSRVKARVGSRSSIMEISYRDTQPDRAVAVSNGVADELSRYYETISTSRADATIAKLDGAIAASSKRMRDIGNLIAADSARNPLVESTNAYDAVTTRLSDLTGQRAFAAATLQSDLAARNALSANPALTQIGRYEKLQNDATYRELVTGSAKDAAQLAFTKAAFTARYPGLPGLETKVQADRQASAARAGTALASPNAFSATLAANALDQRKADAAVAGDRAKVGAIDSLIAASDARLAGLPAATASAHQLQVEADAAKADYLMLAGHRTAAVASRAEALSLGSVVVVDRAVRADAAVVGLNGIKLALVAFALVMGLALGSVFLAEMLDPHLRRPSQIENLYGAHLIATLSMER
jgi:capsular polysaccharide biosynthesis protein